MAGWRQMPKRVFFNIVETAYRDGIGARRLSQMLGYSPTWIRIAARELGLPKLPRHDRSAQASLQLVALLASVEHFKLYKAPRA